MIKGKNRSAKLTREEIKRLKDLEPDALPIIENEEDLLDLIPEEDEFESPKYEKPIPGEGP